MRERIGWTVGRSLLSRKNRIGSAVKADAYGMEPVKAFRNRIRCERARADRNSHCFSLAVFEVPDCRDRNSYVEKLARLLIDRARFTDEVGWLSHCDIGVLLTETLPHGAWVFVDHVRYAMKDAGSAVASRVYTYPESPNHKGGSGPNDHDQMWFESMQTFRKEAVGIPGGVAAMSAHGASAAGASQRGPRETLPFDDAIARYLVVPPPFWKRTIDVVGAAVGLILLSPVVMLTSLLIKLVSPGPVFFKQERIGHFGQPFMCLKFRTMHVNNDATQHKDHFTNLIDNDNPMTKLDLKRDSRIIPFGKFLRQSAIDELPQLINVLRGEMSLVGPRPCIPYEYNAYHVWHRTRVEAMPGLTGLWQVNGKNRTTFKEMMRMDITYAKRLSFRLDALILLRTIPAIVSQVNEGRSRQETADQQLQYA